MSSKQLISKELKANDPAILAFFKEDNDLAKVGLSDRDYSSLLKDELIFGDQNTYVGVYKGDELVALGWFSYFTTIMGECHYFAASKHWQTKVPLEAYYLLEDWLKENTFLTKLMSTCPQSCTNVLKFHTKTGYEIEGVLVNGTIWRGKIENLIMISKFIRRV